MCPLTVDPVRMTVPLPAPLWRRLAALGYDLLVLAAIWMFAAALVLLAFRGEVDVAHQPPLYHYTLQGTLLVLTAGYFILSWCRGGQTIGMRAWKVRLVGANGGRVPFGIALRRFAFACLSVLLAGAGFLVCLVDPGRNAAHDRLAGTRMQRAD